MDSFHLLETTERMAFGNKLRYSSLVKGASDQKHNIVNHVAVPESSVGNRNKYAVNEVETRSITD